MYAKDVRTRVTTYDRMRADQEKLNQLANKMRDMKQRLKAGVPLTPGSPVHEPKRARSASPTRTPQTFDLVDPSAFASSTMREILGVNNHVDDSLNLSMTGTMRMSISNQGTPFVGAFTPASTFRTSHGAFTPTPRTSASPLRASAKRAKLSISTFSTASLSRPAASAGIAQRSASPHRSVARSSSPSRSVARSTSTGHHMSMSRTGGLSTLSRALPPSTFKASVSNLGDYINTPSANHISTEEAKSLYISHYNGLEAIGESGMTVLEELIDAALNVCEKSRASSAQQQTHAHSRSAVLLSATGRTYTGCDVHLAAAGVNSEAHGVSAERAAFLAAVADGASKFDCVVICSDTMKSFPAPDGLSREFMRSFGVFPVVLVNCNLEIKHTTSQELYPLNAVAEGGAQVTVGKASVDHTLGSAGPGKTPLRDSARFERLLQEEQLLSELDVDSAADADAMQWSTERVRKWLVQVGLEDLYNVFQTHLVDGPLLLRMDEGFALESLGIHHALQRRKLMRAVEQLKKAQVRNFKEKTLDEMDEYVMLLETHRIKLVAKLKSIFDLFDANSLGRLSGAQVEQMLVYMNRPVESVQVRDWLLKLKERDDAIEFPEFVAQYSALFAGEDPDVPVGEKKPDDGACSPGRARSRSGLTERDADRDRDEEHWFDREHPERDGRSSPTDTRAGVGHGTVAARFEDKDITDLKMLAELKTIFDRFAVDGAMTAPETCQALTEAGVIVPRREIAQYLRSRKHLGISRTVDYFEFARAFAAIRGPIKAEATEREMRSSMRRRRAYDSDEEWDREIRRSRSREVRDRDRDLRDSRDLADRHHSRGTLRSSSRDARGDGSLDATKGIVGDLYEGMKVEARYQGHGAWYEARITRINPDRSIDVQYRDGEAATGLHHSTVRPFREVKKKSLFIEGEHVEAKKRGGIVWTAGRVRRDREDGTYDIVFSSGEQENRVPEERIRPRRSRGEDVDLCVGDRIEANYRGRGKYYKGKVAKDCGDGTYNIDYDDGEKERGVKRQHIRSSEAGRPASKSAAVEKFREGDRVEGNFRDRGKWYAAQIVFARSDGTYDLDYDDGEKELRVEPRCIRVAAVPLRKRIPLQEGDEIEGNFRGRGKWYPGRISFARCDGTFDIDYNDGEKEMRVEEALIRLVPDISRPARSRSPPARRQGYREGDRVEGNFGGNGRWFAGRISRMHSDGTVDIDYDDGDKERHVDARFVRIADTPPKKFVLEAHARVEARYKRGERWYPGRIKRDRGDSTYDIEYDNGEFESRVRDDCIREYRPPTRTMQEGDRVEGNYRGRGRWYPGVISRANPDGTFNVDYDDGEKETRLESALVRPLGGASVARSPVRAASLREGDRVEGNYRGKGRWYPGVISRANPDGTFNVDYDDGEKETRLESALVRPLGGASVARSPVRSSGAGVVTRSPGFSSTARPSMISPSKQGRFYTID